MPETMDDYPTTDDGSNFFIGLGYGVLFAAIMWGLTCGVFLL